MIFIDRELAEKLERTEAMANVGFVESRAKLIPESGAEWIEIGGAHAMFDGVESPCTQTFGLGMFEDATNAHLDQIEAFFLRHGVPVFHEVCPRASPALLPLLVERGYHPIELSTVLYQPISIERSANFTSPEVSTHIISPDEVDIWARTSAAGWATEHESLGEFMYGFGRISAQIDGSFPYLADIGGKPVAAGMLFIFDDICILAGASTVPEGRRKGAEGALLDSRLRLAAEKGCRLAMMAAAPGSQSQKNAQKNGFHVAYTRTKWQLAQ